MRDSLYFWDEPEQPTVPQETMALEYTIPLRRDFMVQLIVPYNITKREAERLSALLRSLPL